VVIVHAGADESHPLALATSHRSHRPSGLTAGQVALYDSTGKVVTLSTSGIQLGTSASKGVARNTDTVSVTIPANTVAVGFSGGAAVMNALPITLTGTITSGSATVKAVD
jgi:phage gp45-like